MIKTKTEYPLVLTAKDVAEIMQCSTSAARNYISVASAELRNQGKLPPVDVVRNARVPKDLFFNVYGI